MSAIGGGPAPRLRRDGFRANRLVSARGRAACRVLRDQAAHSQQPAVVPYAPDARWLPGWLRQPTVDRTRSLSSSSALQLISLHLPKTAGTSFRHTLEERYPDLIYFDYDGKFNPDLGPMKVVHGHMQAFRYVSFYPNAKLITWLRNPVDRIISYFNFWKTLPRHGNANHDYVLDYDLSLIEFAETEFIRNEVVGHYMKNLALSRFDFVGVIERYQEDLVRLAEMMGWPRVTLYKSNPGPQSSEVSEAERSKIRSLLKTEVEVYEAAFYRKY